MRSPAAAALAGNRRVRAAVWRKDVLSFGGLVCAAERQRRAEECNRAPFRSPITAGHLTLYAARGCTHTAVGHRPKYKLLGPPNVHDL